MYFGNLRKAMYVKDPAPGWNMGGNGSYDGGSLAGGGAFVRPSASTHRAPQMNWPQGDVSEFNFLSDYRNGIYGTGLLYIVDEMYSEDNVLPPHWATPELTTRGWPSLMSLGATPTASDDASLRSINYITAPIPNVTSYTSSNTGVISGPVLATDTATNEPLARFTRVTTATADLRIGYNATPVDTTTVVGTIQARVTGTASVTLAIRAGTSTTNLASSSSVALTSSWQTINTASYSATAGATFSLAVIVASGGSAGNLIEIRRPGILTNGASYFDGSTRLSDGTAGTWAAATNASASSMLVTANNMPKVSAQYLIAGTANTVPARGVTMLIPPDKTLWVGFSGTTDGSALLRAQPIYADGTYAPTQDLTLLSASGTTRLNKSFDGSMYSAVIIYITSTVSGGSLLTLTSGKAVYTALAGTPTLTGNHTPGRGMSGMRWADDTDLVYTFLSKGGVVDRRYGSASARFMEVGAWI